jgi:hypothetical protein
MKIILKPTNNRFKRLIHDFGPEWRATTDPTPMHCFGGMLGVTGIPADGTEKWSNFRLSDIELVE